MTLAEDPAALIPLKQPRCGQQVQALLDALMLLCIDLVREIAQVEGSEQIDILQRVAADVAGY